jgi:hypothetical protein
MFLYLTSLLFLFTPALEPQTRTLDRVKKLNSSKDQGEPWAKGCLWYPSKFFQEQRKK